MSSYIRFIFLILTIVWSGTIFGSLYYSIDYFAPLGGKHPFKPELFINSAIWGTVGVTLFTALSLTTLGDKIASLFFPVRKKSLREAERIDPAVALVTEQYQKAYGKKLHIKSYVMDEPDVNGMAFGRSTIALTKGAIQVAGDDELAALVAHEVGHLHHRDGLLLISTFAAMWPVRFIANIILWPFRGDEEKASPDDTASEDNTGIFLGAIGIFILACIIGLAPYFCLALLSVIPYSIIAGMVGWCAEWPPEYKADRFATELGFGDDLIAILKYFDAHDFRTKSGFLNKYAYSHPPAALRIDKIDRKILEMARG